MLSPGPAGARTEPPRILIVDDDPRLLILLAEQLRDDGFAVATARDGDEALRRLGDRVPRQRLVLGPNLALELHRREAIVRGTPLALTPTESRLLYALAANLGRTVTTETLLVRGWAETEDADPSYVWVTMRRLRQKIEVDPNRPAHLLTVRGVGYRLVTATEAPAGERLDDPAAPVVDRAEAD